MHIPDGFLAMNTWLTTWLISTAGISYSIKIASRKLKERFIPLMGVMSAFIFAAQMLNFPVAGGTSGHLLGGVLAAILLGPFSAAIVISVVLIVQCLIFQDGGITALGANILNMSIIGTMLGYLVYKLICKAIRGNKGIFISTFISAWFSVVLASSACAFELAISGTSPLGIVFPAMVGIHAIIGIGEGLITLLVIGFILRVRPDLIYGKENNFEK